MPLTFATPGEEKTIRRIGGNNQIRLHLENLGFVTGTPIVIVAAIGGNIIVNIKGARIAISREMANKIDI